MEPVLRSRARRCGQEVYRFLTQTAAFPFFIWVALFAHFAEGLTGYTVSMKLTKYLNQRLLMTDIQASGVYSLRVFVVFLLALVGGWVIDKLGKKVCMVLGFLVLGFAKLGLSATDSSLVAEVLIIVWLPVGGGLLVTPIHMTVDVLPYVRTAQIAMKNFAFACLYTSNNLGDAVAGLLDPFISKTGGAHQYDTMFSLAGIVSIIVAILLAFSFYPPDSHHVDVIDESIDYAKQFRKCIWFVIVMCPVRTLFQYLDVLMSKYIERLHDAQWMLLYGQQIDSTWIISHNPLIVMILTPIMGLLLRKQKSIHVMIAGTTLSAFSVLFMVFWRDTSSSLPEQLFMISFSIGESIYSARSIQMLMNFTPPGKKGLYSNIAVLPALIAAGLAGEQAGYLLYYFCPTTVNLAYDPWQQYSCSNLFVPIFFQALISPVMLFVWSGYFEVTMITKVIPPIQLEEIEQKSDSESTEVLVTVAERVLDGEEAGSA